MTFLRKEITQVLFLADKRTKNGRLNSVSDIGRSSKNQAHRVKASNVPHSQVGKSLSAARDSHTAKRQARVAKAYNAHQSLTEEKKRKRISKLVHLVNEKYLRNRKAQLLKERAEHADQCETYDYR